MTMVVSLFLVLMAVLVIGLGWLLLRVLEDMSS